MGTSLSPIHAWNHSEFALCLNVTLNLGIFLLFVVFWVLFDRYEEEFRTLINIETQIVKEKVYYGQDVNMRLSLLRSP